jgi:hypothetical protein
MEMVRIPSSSSFLRKCFCFCISKLHFLQSRRPQNFTPLVIQTSDLSGKDGDVDGAGGGGDGADNEDGLLASPWSELVGGGGRAILEAQVDTRNSHVEVTYIQYQESECPIGQNKKIARVCEVVVVPMQMRNSNPNFVH